MNPFTIFVAFLALIALCVGVAALSVANKAKVASVRNAEAIAALFRRTDLDHVVLEAVARELGVPADARKTTAMLRPAELRAGATPIPTREGPASTPVDDAPPPTLREGSGRRALPRALESDGDEGLDDEATRVANRPDLASKAVENS